MNKTTRALLDAIRANERGSYVEWARAIGAGSTAVIQYHLKKLERLGKITRKAGQSRSVELVKEETDGERADGTSGVHRTGFRSPSRPAPASADGSELVDAAIWVLRAYAAGDLKLERRAALEAAIEQAYHGRIEIDINLDAPPHRRGRTA